MHHFDFKAPDFDWQEIVRPCKEQVKSSKDGLMWRFLPETITEKV